MIKHEIDITLRTYVGIMHFMKIQDICAEIIRKYDFGYNMSATDNNIHIIIYDNGDIDADTLGTFSNELQLEVGIYLHDNYPSSIDPES